MSFYHELEIRLVVHYLSDLAKYLTSARSYIVATTAKEHFVGDRYIYHPFVHLYSDILIVQVAQNSFKALNKS